MTTHDTRRVRLTSACLALLLLLGPANAQHDTPTVFDDGFDDAPPFHEAFRLNITKNPLAATFHDDSFCLVGGNTESEEATLELSIVVEGTTTTHHPEATGHDLYDAGVAMFPDGCHAYGLFARSYGQPATIFEFSPPHYEPVALFENLSPWATRMAMAEDGGVVYMAYDRGPGDVETVTLATYDGGWTEESVTTTPLRAHDRTVEIDVVDGAVAIVTSELDPASLVRTDANDAVMGYQVYVRSAVWERHSILQGGRAAAVAWGDGQPHIAFREDGGCSDSDGYDLVHATFRDGLPTTAKVMVDPDCEALLEQPAIWPWNDGWVVGISYFGCEEGRNCGGTGRIGILTGNGDEWLATGMYPDSMQFLVPVEQPTGSPPMFAYVTDSDRVLRVMAWGPPECTPCNEEPVTEPEPTTPANTTCNECPVVDEPSPGKASPTLSLIVPLLVALAVWRRR